ncbi:MAG: dihydrofolate reductase [Patescibacteria group bacterium]|nr:dihydrofolate reductase [Patescibacteria group bacterium]MDD4610403.1 dihydrofolate reductase [Patescibacteria group bacterium]
MISMICAVGKNREIGYKNKLLWDIPDDMKHFRNITRGHTVIMGQKTYESLQIKPLPNRKNIILTFDKNFEAPGCEIAFDLEKLAEEYKNSSEEIFIIGGGTIYKQFLPYSQKLYLTLVDDAPEADVYFPDFSEFKNVISEEKKEYNGIKYKFVELTR